MFTIPCLVQQLAFLLLNGYQPLLFPAQEEVAVPPVQLHIHLCQKVWKVARQVLMHAQERTCRTTDTRRVSAPPYSPGHKVCLSSRNKPFMCLTSSLYAPALWSLLPYPLLPPVWWVAGQPTLSKSRSSWIGRGMALRSVPESPDLLFRTPP